MSNSTLKYIGKRLVISLITLFVILMVLFLMVKFLPGSPINNEKLSASARAAIEAQYGLDKPIPVQFVRYIQNMLTGDFGVSFNLYKDMQVSSLVGSAAKLSMIYGLCAVIIGTVIGMFLGVFAALHKNTIWDTIATVISVIGVSIPSFVFAMLILLLFASKLRLLPTSYSSSNAIKSSIMPILALSVGVIANVARFTRTEMVSVLTSEYMTLAKAKGLDRKTLIFKHALRNALIPVITYLGPQVAFTLCGGFVVESVFSIPGLGRYFVQSIQNRDYPVIMGTTIFLATFIILMNLVVDLLYKVADPRISLTKGGD